MGCARRSPGTPKTGAGGWAGSTGSARHGRDVLAGGGGIGGGRGRRRVGSHEVERLRQTRSVPAENIVVPRSSTHDLRRLEHCLEVVQGVQIILHLAADVGGMGYSAGHPASQYYNSTLIDLHVMEADRRAGIGKLIAVGSCP